MLNGIQESFKRLGNADDILGIDIIVTADTGFANEENMQYCHDNDINDYIPDNQFRSRNPRFEDHHKVASRQPAKKNKTTFLISAFQYDPIAMTCQCPGDKLLQVKKIGLDAKGNQKIFFEGRLTDCRSCPQKDFCMRNPASADKLTGHGRQVSFITEKKTSYTEWMRHRIDTDEGRAIYGHRMYVVGPVFGSIESNKGLNRFTLRTKQKVKSQWQLYSLVHNIEKPQRYGKIAA